MIFAFTYLLETFGESYNPEGNKIVCVNGNNRFTRAIYGTNTPFRFETSDFPEIGLYMPNLGGSMYFAITNGKKTKWVRETDYVKAEYEAGKRTYIIKDKSLLNDGELCFSFLALSDADGMITKIESHNVPESVKVISIFGGANNEHFRREGDLGADPKDCFYIKPDRCKAIFINGRMRILCCCMVAVNCWAFYLIIQQVD